MKIPTPQTPMPWVPRYYEDEYGNKVLQYMGPLSADHGHWSGPYICGSRDDAEFLEMAVNNFQLMYDALLQAFGCLAAMQMLGLDFSGLAETIDKTQKAIEKVETRDDV